MRKNPKLVGYVIGEGLDRKVGLDYGFRWVFASFHPRCFWKPQLVALIPSDRNTINNNRT